MEGGRNAGRCEHQRRCLRDGATRRGQRSQDGTRAQATLDRTARTRCRYWAAARDQRQSDPGDAAPASVDERRGRRLVAPDDRHRSALVQLSVPLPICHLNGQYLPLSEARISPLDRAFLFGDGVYEVVPVFGGRPFRLRQHLDRLARSLEGIRMTPPLSHLEWSGLCRELIDRNGGGDQYLYMQVTRGAEYGRNHAWPEGLKPTLFAYCSSLEPLPAALAESGVAAVTAGDIRWARRDIKSTALLGNILLKKLAADAGAYETIMLEDGRLTEGSS